MKNKIILAILAVSIILGMFCFTGCGSNFLLKSSSKASVEEITEEDTDEPKTDKETESKTRKASDIDDDDSEELDESEYILPHSDTKKLTKSDLRGLTNEEITLAINEIYARHGRKFNTDYIKNYFNSKSWYRGTVEPDDFDVSVLNSVESYNIDFLVDYRDNDDSSLGGGASTNNFSSSTRDYERYSPKAIDDEESNVNFCSYCKGMGHCPYCMLGSCLYCNGSRTENCKQCVGLGRCGTCGGDGYYYGGVGLSHGKRLCNSCGGSGRCFLCGGTGKTACTMCSGTGSCSLCRGLYTCSYCGGTGMAN